MGGGNQWGGGYVPTTTSGQSMQSGLNVGNWNNHQMSWVQNLTDLANQGMESMMGGNLK